MPEPCLPQTQFAPCNPCTSSSISRATIIIIKIRQELKNQTLRPCPVARCLPHLRKALRGPKPHLWAGMAHDAWLAEGACGVQVSLACMRRPQVEHFPRQEKQQSASERLVASLSRFRMPAASFAGHPHERVGPLGPWFRHQLLHVRPAGFRQVAEAALDVPGLVSRFVRPPAMASEPNGGSMTNQATLLEPNQNSKLASRSWGQECQHESATVWDSDAPGSRISVFPAQTLTASASSRITFRGYGRAHHQ